MKRHKKKHSSHRRTRRKGMAVIVGGQAAIVKGFRKFQERVLENGRIVKRKTTLTKVRFNDGSTKLVKLS